MSAELIPADPNTKINDINIHQDLSCFYEVLHFVVDLWIEEKTKRDEFKNPRNEIVGLVAVMLECINKAAKGKFELMYEEDPKHDYLGSINIKEKPSPAMVNNNSDSPVCSSPHAPTSVLPDPPTLADKLSSTGGSYTPPRLHNLRVQALEKLSSNSKDLKQLASNMMLANNSQQNPKTMLLENSKVEADGQIPIGVSSPTPLKCTVSTTMPPPPQPLSTEAPPHPSLPAINVCAAVPASPPLSCPRSHPPPPGPPVPPLTAPPPPKTLPPGTAPLPPPPMIGKGVVGSKMTKSPSKLKRSTQMAKVYRLLRGIFEGSNCLAGGKGKLSASKKNSSNGGKSIADALAEMTKSSRYFQEIEDDVKKHGKAINELGTALSAFETNDMEELLKFHKSVESQLGVLSDENQVLKRFESFPMEKLETLRSAAAILIRLNLMISEMQNWKAALPLVDSLDKVDNYFDKTKKALDGYESNKDKTSEIFKKNNIQFDFSTITKVKESMVDLSSGFIELALKYRREARAKTSDSLWSKAGGKQMMSAKVLWRAFQFAFKVYSYVGGQDERADTLTAEVAKEFETDPVKGKSA